MSLGGRLRHAWGLFLKRTLNPLTLESARRGRGPFSIVRHVGRRSGREYETPIIVAPIGDDFVVELTYGPRVQWYRNVVAAGGCVIVHRGAEHRVVALEPMDAEGGLAAFTGPQRVVLRLLRRRHFVRFVTA